MKKYKLIKEYPGSPKLGTTVEWSMVLQSYCADVLAIFTCSKEMLLQYTDYWEEIIEYPIGTKVLNTNTNTIYTKKEDGWYRPSEKTAYNDKNITDSKCISVISEEIVEKDYEILCFKNVRCPTFWKKDSQLRDQYCETDGKAPFRHSNFFLTSPDIYQIYSIKRLSDGEIFTVGDKISYSYNYPETGIITKNYTIEQIYFIETLRLSFYVGDGLNLGIKSTFKTKKPLFITEDGVDVFEGDKLYPVYLKELSLRSAYIVNTGFSCMNKDYKDFSTLRAAEDYIVRNKSCLSVSDVKNVIKLIGKDPVLAAQIEYDLLELVKTKL